MPDAKGSRELVPSSGGPLAAAVYAVTPEHLAQLNEEIAHTEQRLRGLKIMRTVAQAALGAEPEKKTRQKRTPPAAPPVTTTRRAATDAENEVVVEPVRDRIAVFLCNGSRTWQQLLGHCGVTPRTLQLAMDSAWFSKNAQGYHLTPAGRAANCE